jgi:hypothetical protein
MIGPLLFKKIEQLTNRNRSLALQVKTTLLDKVMQSRRVQQEVKSLKNEIEELKHGNQRSI